MRIHLLLALLLSADVQATQLTLFEGIAPGPGNVVVVEATDTHPAALQGITLLPLECIGRTQLSELLPEQTRLRTDIPGASRLLLAGEQGSLYKFLRPNPDASVAFGLFLVGPEGRARVVLELAGTGALGTNDPIPNRIAVTADGRALLVATSPEAGGDLLEIDLVAGRVENRTLALEPLEVELNGLVLLEDWGVALSRQGVLRFERTSGAQASQLPLATPRRWLGADVVRSADGSTVAFLAGESSDHALVFAAQREGDARQVSRQPMCIPGAGFLPEDPTGPALALSTDGSHVAWRAGGTSRECFVRAIGAAGRPSALHVTGAELFDYTLNDTGVIAFVDPDSLVLVVGRSAKDGIVLGDFFRLDLEGDVAVASNLSLTSGLRLPPFDYGSLQTSDGIYRMPGPEPAFLLKEEGYSVYGSRLLWIGLSGAPIELLNGVESLDSLEVVGNHVVAAVTRRPSIDDPRTRPIDLVQIPPGGRDAVVVRLPDGCHLSRTAGRRSHGDFAAVLEFPTGERLGRLAVPGRSGLALTASLLTYGPTTGIAPDGAILATVQVGLERATIAWSEHGAEVLRATRSESFLLPGL